MEQYYGLWRTLDSAMLYYIPDYAETYCRRYDKRIRKGLIN